MHEPRTYQAQLAIAAARLKATGHDRPAREARHLMQHVCQMNPTELINRETDPMSEADSQAFFDLVERRASGEPFEYLTGEAWFYGLAFHCTPDTLIPRIDSEVVVDEALARIPLGREAHIADLGTGTGCLLITLLANHPRATGVGVERSRRAAAIAESNLERHGLGTRAAVQTGSWEDWQGWAEADLIISNPPYIASKVVGTLDESVRAYEPHEALDGGRDGLDAYRSIVSMGQTRLKPGAWRVFEIGFDQREAVMTLMETAGFAQVSSAQDTGQRDRVVCGRR